MSGDQTRAERKIVRAFIDERAAYAAALMDLPFDVQMGHLVHRAEDASTYWYQQGQAAARRELAEALGIALDDRGGVAPDSAMDEFEAADDIHRRWE